MREEIKVDRGHKHNIWLLLCVQASAGDHQALCGLNTRDELSQSSGDWNSKMAGSPGASYQGLQTDRGISCGL